MHAIGRIQRLLVHQYCASIMKKKLLSHQQRPNKSPPPSLTETTAILPKYQRVGEGTFPQKLLRSGKTGSITLADIPLKLPLKPRCWYTSVDVVLPAYLFIPSSVAPAGAPAPRHRNILTNISSLEPPRCTRLMAALHWQEKYKTRSVGRQKIAVSRSNSDNRWSTSVVGLPGRSCPVLGCWFT